MRGSSEVVCKLVVKLVFAYALLVFVVGKPDVKLVFALFVVVVVFIALMLDCVTEDSVTVVFDGEMLVVTVVMTVVMSEMI